MQRRQNSIFLLTLSAILYCSVALDLQNGHPIAKTKEGLLRGQVLQSRDGRDYYSFKGIKYGQFPHRFALSSPVKPWHDVSDALEYGSDCPGYRVLENIVHGDNEDCLFLNVFTPSLKEDAKLPILFFIHGGGYVDGAGSEYGPEYFMDEPVILVTINYRLGAPGFLNTGDGAVPANNGFKDMILALKWVQRNIGAFGGDPDRVTIFGESAGAGAVHHLQLSPAAKGLFHGVIAMSGNALCPWSVQPWTTAVAKELGANVGCPTGNSKELVECLRTAPIRKIMVAPDSSELRVIGNLTMGPSIENPAFVQSPDYPFMPAHPIELLTKYENNNKRVPLIAGVDELDAVLLCAEVMANADKMAELDEEWEKLAPIHLLYHRYSRIDRQKEFGRQLRKLYFGNKKISRETRLSLAHVCTDVYFARGSRLAVEHHAKLGGKAYMYEFTYNSDFSLAHLLGIPDIEGPIHADELRFIFSNMTAFDLPWPAPKPGSKEEQFSRKMVSLWVSFATNGVPSANWGDKWEPVTSSDVKEGQFRELRIDEVPRMVVNSKAHARYVKIDALMSANEVTPLSWRKDIVRKDEL